MLLGMYVQNIGCQNGNLLNLSSSIVTYSQPIPIADYEYSRGKETERESEMNKLTNDDENLLKKLEKIFATLRLVRPDMSLQLAQQFILVALNEGTSLGGLAEKSGWVLATASRQLLDLGDRDRHGREGLKLVNSIRDKDNLKKNVYTLSPKGKQVINQLVDIVR